MSPLSTYLSIEEVQQDLRVSRPTVYRLLDDGELLAIKQGRRRLILRESLQRYHRRKLEEAYGPLPDGELPDIVA